MSHNTSSKANDDDRPDMMMRAFSPIPSEEIRPLFEFYFKPENFITNTNKYFDCTSENLPKPETDFPVSIDLHDEAIKNNSLR